MKAALPIALTLIVVVQAGLFIANSSGTYDETIYWRMADAALNHSDRSEFAKKGVAPLPVLVAYALPVLNDVTNYAQAILLARFAAVTFTAVPTVLIIYFWMAGRFGVAAGAT